VPGTQPDGNTIIFKAPEGLVVVDTGRHVEHTQAIVDYARSLGNPVAAIVNTHWHLDHIGGNAMLRDAYPRLRVYASHAIAGAMIGFLADYRKQLEEMISRTEDADLKKTFRTEVALIDAGPKLAPDEVVWTSGTRSIAGRKLQLNLAKNAATAGDVWIFDPKTKTVVSGDLVTLPAPFLDTACPKGWRSALASIAKTDFKVLIPGHGAPMSRKGFDAYRGAFDDLLDCAATDRTGKVCVDAWIAATRPLARGEDERFTRSLMDYYVGLLRSDPAKITARCSEKL
jgi:glyoxylase-like metal-dependent hydrolase (beta-lactamase superfamily II)